MPSIICSLLISSVLYVIFTMKGRGCNYSLSLSSKMLHRFISTTPLHTHHKVYDAPALTCAVVVPQVLPKVYLHTSIEVFSVRCMIKGIPVVPLGRFDTIGSMQIVGYWYCLKVL